MPELQQAATLRPRARQMSGANSFKRCVLLRQLSSAEVDGVGCRVRGPGGRAVGMQSAC